MAKSIRQVERLRDEFALSRDRESWFVHGVRGQFQ